jgi:hypothetical protein
LRHLHFGFGGADIDLGLFLGGVGGQALGVAGLDRRPRGLHGRLARLELPPRLVENLLVHDPIGHQAGESLDLTGPALHVGLVAVHVGLGLGKRLGGRHDVALGDEVLLVRLLDQRPVQR